MATFKMDDLMQSAEGRAFNARELSSKSREVVTTVVGRRGKRTPEESKTLIRNFILGAGRPVSMLDICDHIGRRPSPHFRAILEALEAEGVIVKTHDFGASPNIPRFWWERA